MSLAVSILGLIVLLLGMLGYFFRASLGRLVKGRYEAVREDNRQGKRIASWIPGTRAFAIVAFAYVVIGLMFVVVGVAAGL
jgi:hypothetical protein